MRDGGFVGSRLLSMEDVQSLSTHSATRRPQPPSPKPWWQEGGPALCQALELAEFFKKRG